MKFKMMKIGSKSRLGTLCAGLALALAGGIGWAQQSAEPAKATPYLAPLTGTAALIVGIAAIALLLSAMLSRCLVYKLAGIDTTTKEAPYSTTDDRAGL